MQRSRQFRSGSRAANAVAMATGNAAPGAATSGTAVLQPACQQQHWPRHKQLCGELAAQLSWADFMQRLGQRLQISRLMDLPDSPMRQLMPDHVLAPFQYPCWPWLLFGSFQLVPSGMPNGGENPHIHTALSLAPVPGIPVFMYSSLDEPPRAALTNRPECPTLGRPVPASLSELVERPAAVLRDSASLLGLIFPKESPLLGLAYFYVRSGGIGDPHPAGVPDEGAEVSDIVRGGQLVHPLGWPRYLCRALLNAAVEQRAVGEAVNALAAPVHTDIQRNVVSARDGGLEAPPDVEGGRSTIHIAQVHVDVVKVAADKVHMRD
uniref:SUFU domain-containing protein n=1 Tax=Macrostomum lignano TaxID=282301 RepID=A0A1I8F397_9PLAT